MNQLVKPALLGLTLCLGLGSGCQAKPDHEHAPIDIDLRRYVVDLGEAEDDYALGGEQPLVTIVVWSDYACAPCGRTWKVMQHLVEDYGDDLRVVYRAGTIPGFAHGERAAEAALAAGEQGKFWEMHWRLFEHPDDFSRPVLLAHAEAIGLDVAQFMDDLDTGRFAGRRIRDRRQAMELGLSPLPVAFANGLYVLGFKDEAGWHALIDREIVSARKMLQDGIKRADIYEEFMRTAKRGRVDEGNDKSKAEVERLEAERRALAEASKPGSLHGPEPEQRYAVPTGASGFGPADAPVVIVEFVDYQCPFCFKAQTEVIPALREQFPDDLRVEIRHLPLEIHPAAAAAARAAITAGEQGKFGEFHEALFAEDNRGSLGFSTFVRVAEQLGLDIERFKRDFQTRAVGDQLAADVLLARRLGVQGTPGFFVNGRYVEGARNAATFARMVDEELERAKQLEAEGTPRSELCRADARGPWSRTVPQRPARARRARVGARFSNLHGRTSRLVRPALRNSRWRGPSKVSQRHKANKDITHETFDDPHHHRHWPHLRPRPRVDCLHPAAQQERGRCARDQRRVRDHGSGRRQVELQDHR